MTAFLIATAPFAPLVRAQAKSRGVEPRLIVIGHPIGGLNEEELHERIEEGTRAFLEELKKGGSEDIP